MRVGKAIAVVGVALALLAPAFAQSPSTPAAQSETAALAEKLQNPVGDLISVPFQNNTNFGVGPHNGTQNVLNIQPVIPIHVNADWNVITRTILPLVWNPSFGPGQDATFGSAPTVFTAFLSPSVPVDGWVWGAGPVAQIPTMSSTTFGSNIWGMGPAAVIVRTSHPWVYGTLVNNVFSLGGTSKPGGTRYSVMTVNPFVNYNFGEGWFVGSVPIITASWDTPGTKWTVPIGLQAGRLIKLGDKLPVNLLIGAYDNVIQPKFGASWQLRTQVAVIF